MTTSAARRANHSYADYLDWDDGRFELIDGEVFDMSPAPSTEHQRVVVALLAQIHRQLDDAGGECEVFVAPFDVRLPDGETAEPASDIEDVDIDTVVQPDLLVVCDGSKLDERGCLGAPDWIVEVISPSTASTDQMLKRQLYERHGVREYWLVHPGDRTLTVYRPGVDGRYGAPRVVDAAGRSRVELLPALEIDWSIIFRE